MRTLTCDICSKVVELDRELIELKDALRVNGIIDMCIECNRTIDKLYIDNRNRLLATLDEDTKKDIIALREKYRK